MKQLREVLNMLADIKHFVQTLAGNDSGLRHLLLRN